MDYRASPREKGDGFWVSPRSQAHGSMFLDGGGARRSISEDPLDNLSGLMGLDSYSGWCNSPSVTEGLFTSYGSSSIPSLPFDAMGASFGSEFSFPTDSTEADKSGARQNSYPFQQNSIQDVWSSGRCMLSQPIGPSLAEKMLKALSMLKESSGEGILAQVWAPMKLGEQYVLSTYEQPYLLDHMLAGYREVSRAYTFSTEVKPGSFPGLPGRVFRSRVPEWTSDIVYYNNTEYLRVKHAVDHDVHGSIALPVFDSHDSSCCAVLELVTVKEKPNFDSEIESVCHALQSVNLRSSAPPRLHNQCLSRNQKVALAEIADVLRAVCHAHRLPLAMTWIPSNNIDKAHEKSILCIEDTACYVNDRSMRGFVHACGENYLEEGQGIAGKALQSNHPFFFPDVKTCDINEYPLVHHARKFGLNAAVAIRLRSTYTGNDDYILEFFLPVDMKGSSEQQLLLNNLSGTMQRLCRSLRTVSGTELVGVEVSSIEVQKGAATEFPIAMSRRNSHTALSDSDFSFNDLNVSEPRKDGMEADGTLEQTMGGSRKQLEKKRSTSEKNVSLSVLQQYFSGSLKDAAKSIGVCPTTLKRICRQHGISRWPSRKINKVNRSLRKIQTVLDSVQGVEGGLKFDPASGGFVAAGSVVQESDPQKNLLFSEKDSLVRDCEPVNLAVKMEENEGFVYSRTLQVPHTGREEPKHKWGPKNESFKLENSDHNYYISQSSSSLAATDEMELGADGDGDDGIVEHNQLASVMTESSIGSGSTIRSRDSDSAITVKATYKEDTSRFKFDPSLGCFQLYEEVARRFKLQNGMFQLKYLDDEDEWVMLVSDSDLQECLEILELMGKHSVKFLVREMACAMGSSSGSNGFLVGGS